LKTRLLIIDPQNDFCDLPGAALPVDGADADMQRLAHFIDAHRSKIDRIIVTFDTQPTLAIERVSFWRTRAGWAVAPFTQISAGAVAAGAFTPHRREYLPEALAYLRSLEAGGKYQLTVWPIHCVLGTWGHNLHAQIARSVTAWELHHGDNALKITKGMNPMTEQYSALRAEVPRADDPTTQLNQTLLEACAGTEQLLVAGQAASHCVAATVDDLQAHLPDDQVPQLTLLTDCMSPVSGFDAQATAFFERARRAGARTCRSGDVSFTNPQRNVSHGDVR
jgi:nicotinamidase/pyrazinamidase